MNRLEALCGSEFYNNQTVYSDNPDFTVCFQQTVLIWIPCAVLLIISPLWIYMLTRQVTSKLRIHWLFVLRFVLTSVLLAFEVYHLYTAHLEKREQLVFFVSPMIAIAAYIMAMVIMAYERVRGLKSSSLMFTFWTLTFLCSSIRLRSEIISYTQHHSDPVKLTLFSIFYGIVVLLTLLSLYVLPAPPSTDFEKEGELKVLPENQVSLLSKLTFWWINRIIVTGFKRELTREDLWKIDETESSAYNSERFEYFWNGKANNYIRAVRKNPELYEKKSKKSNKAPKSDGNVTEEQAVLNETTPNVDFKSANKVTKPSFGFTLMRVYHGKFLGGAFLKFVYDLFQFVGPIILDKIIKFINDREQNIIVGLFLTGILFISSLIQSFVLQHYFHRMFICGARIRTAIMNIVYKKSLRLSASARRQATIGEMTNLVAVNAQTCCDLTTYLNILWSSPLQIIIAIYLLWTYLGVSALIGVATMIIFIPVNLMLANRTKKLQTKKLKIQDSRIKMMNEILAGMKVLKFYGWELSFKDIVLGIRKKELDFLKKIGLLGVATSFTWTCAPLIVSIVSFASFVLLDENNVLDATTAFVSLALFNILRFPMTVLPGIISAIINANVSLKRIRDFLLLDEINTSDVTYDFTPGVAMKVENVDLGYDNKEAYFHNLNLEVKKGELVAVVGGVGSGKSSLLYGILGEMHKLNSGTININGTRAYVAQQAWIQNATLKDNILFGRPYDEATYNQVLQASCLITDLNIMPAGDQTEIGEKGINLSGGQKQRISLARSLYADADIYFLDDPLSAVDSHVGKDLFDQVIGPNGLLQKKTRVFVTNALSFLPQVDRVIMMLNGEVVEIGSYEDLLKQNGPFSTFMQQYLKDSAKEESEDEETSDEKKTKDSTKVASKMQETVVNRSANDKAGEKIIAKEKIEQGKVKTSIFTAYFKACGWGFTAIAVLSFGLSSLSQVGSSIWLSQWSNDAKSGVTNTGWRLGIYAVLGLIQIIISLSTDVFYLILLLNGARILHNRMLKSILRSTMEFFDSTPSGRIINRFSKDVDATERGIPESFRTLLRCFFNVFSTVLLISASTPMFLLALVPIAVFYVMIQRYFVASMRQLKRLDSASKSPIFSHFSESLTGVSSIRAYKVQHRFIGDMQDRIDENLLYYFPNNISNRWLALRLELIGNLITVFAALFAVLARNSISAGVAALSITYSLNVSQTLNWLVRMSAEFETNVTSAERIEEYCNTPHEAEWSIEKTKPKPDWPDKGHIVLDNYSVKYREELENVLNGIVADIKPGEKIGIVGRTGAGKSTVSLGLFRILEYSTGNIFIDDVDIKQIGLHDLRHKLTIIPQDPVLFSGTLRINLDPFGKYSDEKLWEALEHAHLKTFVKSLENGLEFECSEGGENLSVGQRQLVCLARALLRKTKILLLDEATASVDHNTDELIQNTIRKEFADCTILTVAHRLNTIMDSSRIMVLDKGKIVEFESPAELLGNKNGIFYSMAKDAGIV